ncbi:TonB-dependent receptor plug domain-containing protein [Pararhizobium haloflavum]|uniref:TonB-dependent receptor plug domain-containing protein n=1 Tax=Pararhizobium haloflavum TaxID=2037914 RepID=UPI000C189A3B|nr:TonB-dependent receptor [Pararhizobium haloflavum]
MQRVVCATFLFAAPAMFSIISPALAQEPSATLLDPLLVTDGLTSIEPKKSGRAVTVIDRDDLERSQARYVADALRGVPGFAVTRSGSYGSQTQVRVRGAEANHLLVLIDGVEASETATGEFDFGSLVVDDIERIEILRGPQSTFWGSNALAGVVNIITRRGERGGFSARARSEFGSDGAFLGGVALSGGGENYDAALSGSWRRTDGTNISDFGNEKDGDRNTTLNGTLTADIAPGLSLDGTLRYVDRRTELDVQDYAFGSPTEGLVIDSDEETATQEVFGSVGLTHTSLDGAWTQKARLTGSDTFRENFTDGGLTTSSDGNRVNASFQSTYAFDTPDILDARHKITGGYEWERETFLPSHLTDRQDRSTHSLVGEYRGEFLDQFYVTAAVRQDFNDRFSDVSTYSLGSAWAVPGTATRFHASLGTGVTNPTFVEQFGFLPENFVGNPDLEPEESFGWDVGVEQGFFNDALVVDLTYFNQDLTNEIATVFGGAPDFLSTVVNRQGESRRQGVEVAATLDLSNGFSAFATYTYTDASEQTAAGGPRQREVRRPRHSGSVGAAYRFYDDRARLFAEMIFNGEREDLAFVPSLPPRVTLDDYQTVTVGGDFAISDNFDIYGRIENLFDEDYEEVFGHNSPGRSAFVGMRATF